MLINLVPKMKLHTELSCSGRNHTILLVMLVAEKVLLLLVISLNDYRNQSNWFRPTLDICEIDRPIVCKSRDVVNETFFHLIDLNAAQVMNEWYQHETTLLSQYQQTIVWSFEKKNRNEPNLIWRVIMCYSCGIRLTVRHLVEMIM